ncbi:TRAP transporter small permease [Mangrovicoccus algicola]|uniref:TRAP transporter small permease protein n=1 Tax=Mangrovicoccus algicola TaxID=2771008 RepID=A0A8J6Z1P7_9RHOB|nr:TRAP transporter small permease subunit [Mangrovicoccus algicola]MBE3639966.1 TRAP transporter small permease subunit [Mangrovicoccus algicola]
MARGDAFRRAADRAIAVLTAVVVTVFSVMMALVFVQVIDRFVPAFGWFWTEELVRMLLIWSVMLGLPVVLYRHEEILVEILPLPEGLTVWRLRLAAALGAVFLALLAWSGVEFTQRSGAFASPTLGIARAWLYAPIPLGAALGIVALAIRPRLGEGRTLA